MSHDPVFASEIKTRSCQFVNGGAPAQVLWQAGPRGARIHLIAATQDDTLTAALSFWRGDTLTDNARPAPGVPLGPQSGGLTPILAATKTTNDHLDRTNGSFVQDGWVGGNNLAIVGANDNPQNQVIGHVTTVATTTLTYTGTPLQASASAMSPTTKLVRVDLLWTKALVSGCGNTDGVPAINMLDPAKYPSLLSAPDTFLLLGPCQLLIVKLATLPAANKSVNVLADGADY